MAASASPIVGVLTCPCGLVTDPPSSTGRQCRLRGIGFATSSKLCLRVRASAATSAPAEESATDEGSGLLRQSSILSKEAINSVLLAGELPVTVNHYSRLGLPREASEGQIRSAYRKLVLETKGRDIPDDEKDRIVRGLRESYDLLTTVEERRLYDWSLDRAEYRDERYVWPHEADITQRDYAPASDTSEEDEEGNRITARFYLGWFALSVVLNLFLHNPN